MLHLLAIFYKNCHSAFMFTNLVQWMHPLSLFVYSIAYSWNTSKRLQDPSDIYEYTLLLLKNNWQPLWGWGDRRASHPCILPSPPPPPHIPVTALPPTRKLPMIVLFHKTTKQTFKNTSLKLVQKIRTSSIFKI